jgi:hypothetical protein
MLSMSPTPPEPITCEECFTENLNDEQLENLIIVLSLLSLQDLEGLCEGLSDSTTTNQDRISALQFLFTQARITDENAFLQILECLEELD